MNLHRVSFPNSKNTDRGQMLLTGTNRINSKLEKNNGPVFFIFEKNHFSQSLRFTF